MVEKILIVDDDMDSLKLIGLMLQRNGYEVSAARSGSQALAKAEAEQPDLIILDVMMPDMNGLDVCRRLRTGASTSQIPIIMFTAKTLIDDKVKGFEAGADDYLTKPTHPAELTSRVKAVLTRQAAKVGSQRNNLRPQATVIGVLGAKGGVGTTTVALNLTAALQQQNEQPLLADFRLGMGSLGWMPGMKTGSGTGRLVAYPVGDITNRSVESELLLHPSGFRVLPAAPRPTEVQQVFNQEAAQAVLNQLRGQARNVVLDLGCGLTPLVAHLYPHLNQLLLVVEPNPVAVNMARELIIELEAIGEGRQIHIIVVNRSNSTLQTPWHEIENILGRDIKAIIAANPDLAFQSLQNGMPMVTLQPSAIISGQFVKLAEIITAAKNN
jgi:pilus assembly protein CpaE